MLFDSPDHKEDEYPPKPRPGKASMRQILAFLLTMGSAQSCETDMFSTPSATQQKEPAVSQTAYQLGTMNIIDLEGFGDYKYPDFRGEIDIFMQDDARTFAAWVNLHDDRKGPQVFCSAMKRRISNFLDVLFRNGVGTMMPGVSGPEEFARNVDILRAWANR